MPNDVIVGLPPDSDASAALATQLDAARFDAGTDDASVESSSGTKNNRSSIIRFGLRGIEAARLLASHLDGNVAYQFSTELPGRRLELIPGPTPPTVRATPNAITQVPLPTIPESRSGRGTTTTSSTTSSTVSSTVSSTTTSTATAANASTTVVSPPTTSTLQGDVTTTTAIGIVTLDAKKASDCNP